MREKLIQTILGAVLLLSLAFSIHDTAPAIGVSDRTAGALQAACQTRAGLPDATICEASLTQ